MLNIYGNTMAAHQMKNILENVHKVKQRKESGYKKKKTNPHQKTSKQTNKHTQKLPWAKFSKAFDKLCLTYLGCI